MSAATLEGNQSLPGDQPAGHGKQDNTPPSTRPAWAASLGALEDALTEGTHEEQQEAGRAIIRIAVAKGEKLSGPGKLTGDTMATHLEWSPRWWRERLREVRAERGAGSTAKLTVVTSTPANTTDDSETPEDRQATRATGDASHATAHTAERATAASGTGGEALAAVASTHPDPVASPAPSDVPSAPPVPAADPDGPTGRADLAVAQHTARGTRGTNKIPSSRSGHHQHPGIGGADGTTGTATVPTEDPHVDATLRPLDRPALPSRATGAGWPDSGVLTDPGTSPHNLASAAPQGASEPAAPSTEASVQDRPARSTGGGTQIVARSPYNLQDHAADVMAAWGAGEHQQPQRARRQPLVQTHPRPAPAPDAVASPLPAKTDSLTMALPPTEVISAGPLPPAAPSTGGGSDSHPAPAPVAQTLATPAARHEPRAMTAAAGDEPAIVASTAQTNGTPGEAHRPAVASTPVPATAVHATEISGAAKLQYAFYGTASLFALIGQVWAALDHITIGGGWPTWLQALAMAPALAVIELAGVATSHQADLRRRLGEQAYGYRALSLMAATVAAGVNLLGHWGEWFPAVGFIGLSVFAYCSWLMQSAARRRDALRATGQMANTAPVFGPIQWIRQPKLTWRARLIAISEGHGRSESLLLAAQRMHREARDKAIAKAVRKVIKTQKKDANGAIIAAATIDPETLATALKARTDYAAWTDHLSADLAPPARDAG